jgi:hypothetical protein
MYIIAELRYHWVDTVEEVEAMARVVRSFRLSQQEIDLLHGLAARRGSSPSALIRHLIQSLDYPEAGERLSEPVVALVPKGAAEALEEIARQDDQTPCRALTAILRHGRSSLVSHWR